MIILHRLNWGGIVDSESGFRVIFFATFVLVIVTRVYFRRKLKRAGRAGLSVGKDAAEREGRGGILWRGILFFYMVAVVVIYAFNPLWLEQLAVNLPLWSRWLGTGIAAISLALLVWVHLALGRQWSANLELREEHLLITKGPYKSVRHPMYSAFIGLAGGLALVSASWPIIFLAIMTLLVLCTRVSREESMMIESFGDEYRAYMKYTGRLLPRLGRGER